MSERDYILSPQQKRILQPLVQYLSPENIKGVKEIVINTPGEVGKELFDGTWTFDRQPALTEEVLMDAVKILAEMTGQTFNLNNPLFFPLECQVATVRKLLVVFKMLSGFPWPFVCTIKNVNLH